MGKESTDMTREEVIAKATHPVEIKESDYLRYMSFDLEKMLRDFQEMFDQREKCNLRGRVVRKLFCNYVISKISEDIDTRRCIYQYFDAFMKGCDTDGYEHND